MRLSSPSTRVNRPVALKRLLLGGLPTLLGCALTLTSPAHGGQAGSSTTPTLGEALAPSDSTQLELTEHLRRIGALFYGAWWCPACFQQKNLFGKEGGNSLPYVECDKTDDGRSRCMAAQIRAFPTWDLAGKERREGVQTIEELKVWSGFTGAAKPSQP